MLALQLACLGWSLGSSYSRRHARQTNVFSATAAQMLAGGLMMLAIGTAQGEWASLRFSPRALTAFVYLSTVGAIGGFLIALKAVLH